MPSKKDPRLTKNGLSGYNKPKATPNHPKKSHVVLAKEGDKVKVKFLGQDDRGKIRLSMKVVDQQTGEDLTEKLKAQRDAERAERGEEPREPRESREGGRSHRGERRRDAGE